MAANSIVLAGQVCSGGFGSRRKAFRAAAAAAAKLNWCLRLKI